MWKGQTTYNITLYSARILLHETHLSYESKHRELCDCVMGPIEVSCHRVIDIATHFIASADVTDIEALSCLVPYMVYQAVTVERKLAIETNDEKHIQAVAVLTEMLWHFSKRWNIAGKYTDYRDQWVKFANYYPTGHYYEQIDSFVKQELSSLL